MSEIDEGLQHASAVAFVDRALLILGASGSGKSELVAQLIVMGGVLISDDQVQIVASNPPAASVAPNLEGLLEMRGIGLVRMPFQNRAAIYLCVDLDRKPDARMPEHQDIVICDTSVPLIAGKGVAGLAAYCTLLMRKEVRLQ